MWVDQNDNIFYGESHTPLELKMTTVIQNKRLNFLKNGDSVFYTSTENGASQLMQFDIKTHKTIQHFKTDMANEFSVSESGIYYSQLTSSYSNIYSASGK